MRVAKVAPFDLGLLARAIEERARARGVATVSDGLGGRSTSPRSTGAGATAAASPNATRRPRSTGSCDTLGTDFEPGHTLHPHQRFVQNKEVWPTLTGRQQFLIDHPWYLEAGEALPVHEEAPKAGGEHPLRLTGGHTRWSIHATWRDSPLMLRLREGAVVVAHAHRVAVGDAARRGVARRHVHDELAALRRWRRWRPRSSADSSWSTTRGSPLSTRAGRARASRSWRRGSCTSSATTTSSTTA